MSGKAPAFQFYPGDWLRDPELGLASAATQGVWINFLCQMWFARDRGVLSGNLSQLAQLGRCQSDDVVRFLSEAKALKFCDVSEDGHGVVTVTNRRMANEEKARVFARERKARERERKSESRDSHTENPQVSRQCHSASPIPNLQSPSPDLQKPEQKETSAAADLQSAPRTNGSSRVAVKLREWAQDELWLKQALESQTVFTGEFRERLLKDPDWWGSLYQEINGFDAGFVAQQFAGMERWIRQSPQARAPTLTGVRKFVGGWFKRQGETRRKQARYA